MSNFSGIIPAIVTPLNGDGSFNESAFALLTDRMYTAGVHGLYVCGQTGEGLQQSAAQRMRVTEAAVRMSPAGKQVIVHVGAHSTDEAVTLARHALKCGVHAISALPPGAAYSFSEIHDYYAALASAVDIPLLIYYFPTFAPKIESTDQFLELCQIPNVIGLKFTHSNLFTMHEIKRRGYCILYGSDEMLVSGLLMGADGGIGTTYNLIPEEYLRLYEFAMAGNWSEALAVQSQVNELIDVILRFPVLPAVKLMLQWQGIDCGSSIRPRRDLTDSEIMDLKKRLGDTQLGRKRWATLPAARG